MTDSVADIQLILQEGRAAALAGDSFAARSAFRRATELDPANVAAWLGLSGTVPILSEKREYLQRVLEIEPGHPEAAASLQYVDRLIAEGQRLAPSQRRSEPATLSATDEPAILQSDPQPVAAVEYCYIHPDRETGLHCIQCNRPICGACAKVTPVGQLCPECRNLRRPANYKSEPSHMILGGLIGFVGALIACVPLLFVSRLPFIGLFLVLLAGPFVAETIIRIVDRVTRVKRGRPMQIVVGLGLALGTLPLVLLTLLAPSLMTLLLILYLVLVVSTAVARLR